MTPESIMARAEFDPNSGCWLWTRSLDTQGYGQIHYEGRVRLAHRVSWALKNGRYPSPAEFVLHGCDTPACVNPDHLHLGNQLDNMREMIARGRRRGPDVRGSCNAQALLTEEIVLAIRSDAGATPAAVLAHRYGVHRATIYRALAATTWQHVPSNARCDALDRCGAALGSV